jgi:hypothetical protein
MPDGKRDYIYSMKFSEFSRIERIGMIGIAVLSFISIILAFFNISPVYTAPFFLPWFVFLMIGRGRRKNK